MTASMDRLNAAALPGLRGRAGVTVPDQLPDRIGIVHLGIGAFHRAHQAVFTQAALAADPRWGICGVTQRSASVRDQLAPQDGLYAVLESGDGSGGESVSAEVVGTVREVLFALEQPELVRDRLADPGVGVVTLTVTEKGYRRDPAGGLDRSDPVVAADLASGIPGSAVGQLVRGLQARLIDNGAPVTVISCDNLVANGATLARLVTDFCQGLPGAEGGPLLDWIHREVRFPSSMVDRIVPATTADDRSRAETLLGLHDAGLVVAEPFRQWVIEAPAGDPDEPWPLPAWELGGAILTDDVAPWEAAKLRLLNASHSLLAYAGALAGYATIGEAVHDDELRGLAQALMTQDARPTLTPPPGLDLDAYCAEVLTRFANPALRHTTEQVAMDGSMKLPLRLLGTVRERLAAGGQPVWAALAVAAWMVYVARGTDGHGRPLRLQDPIADRLRQAAAGGPDGLVERLLGVREVFDEELAGSAPFADLLREHVDRLWKAAG